MRSKIDLTANKARLWVEANMNKHRYGPGYQGACAWASTYLLSRLLDEQIESYVAISKTYDGQHAFVVAKDYIVDITASQFRHAVDKYIPEVIVMEREKGREFFWNDVIARLYTPQAVVDFTLKPKWPKEQIPDLTFIKDTYENF